MQIEYAKMLKWFQHNHPEQIWRFVESVSPNQQESKHHLLFGLLEKDVVIPTDDHGQVKIEIVGGWFGWPLLGMLQRHFGDKIKQVDFFEIDPFCKKVLYKYIEIMKPRFEVRVFDDWFEYKERRRSHVIINTSCEHMPDFGHMKEYFISPERTLLMLTSNNKTDEPDHINCKELPDDLARDNDVRLLHGDSIFFEKDFIPINDEECKKSMSYYRHVVIGKWN